MFVEIIFIVSTVGTWWNILIFQLQDVSPRGFSRDHENDFDIQELKITLSNYVSQI